MPASLLSPRSPARVLAGVVAFLLSSAAPLAAQAQGPRLGKIDFPTSGSAEAQPYFVRGVLYLHSFEYDSAAKQFREAQRIDPGFAMAYWGEAMTHNHPVWNQQDRDAARAILARLAPTAEGRQAKAKTEREKRFLQTLEVLYGEGSKERRDTLYADAMARLAVDFPDDHEVRAFHALALLGINQGNRNVPAYMHAARISDEIFRANPQHPGAAHYIIHAFDDPIHAPLGLRAARAYSTIAPEAAHAQHMTSHIFVALGMWDDVVRANEVAWAQSGHHSGHYSSWLAYGYLQQGRYAEARRVIDAMVKAAGHAPHLFVAVGAMRAAYVVETGDHAGDVARMRLDLTRMNPYAVAMNLYATGYAALARGDRAAGAAATDSITSILRAGRQGSQGRSAPWIPSAELAEQQLRAMLASVDGNTDEAARLLRSAAESQEARPFEFGPPDPAKPLRELLGEMLLAAKRPAEAKRELELALARAPRRTRALLGVARANVALGDRDEANRVYAELRSIWHRAESGHPEMAEAAKQR